MAGEKQPHDASSCLSYDLLCFWLENINNFKVSDAHGVQSVRKSQACTLVLVDCRCRTAGIGLPTFLDNASQQKYQQTSQQIQQQQMDMQAHASAVWNLSEWGYVPANGKKTTRLRGQNVGQKDGMCHFEIMPTVVSAFLSFRPRYAICSGPLYIYNLLHIDGPQPIHFCHLWGFKDNFLGCHWMPLNSNPHDQSTISN